MRTAVRLTGFAAGLALVFAIAWLVGTAAGPKPPGSAAPAELHLETAARPHDAATGTDGLAATAAGYTLVPQPAAFTAGVPAEFAFAITGADGRPVTAYDVEHERQLHLIVLRRDTAGFQHLHPVLGPDG